jgi:lipopolysaccharide/colanic/teichoic acid biosynthesis glycosyltransferase
LEPPLLDPAGGTQLRGSLAPDVEFQVRDSLAYRVSKRTLDIAAALFGLTLLAPLFPLIVLLIRLDSGGPVIFAQRRVGRGGRLFTCYKFRSMVRDAEAMKSSLAHLNEASGAAFKIRRDPRITEVGHFLRRSSLDEIPQLASRSSPESPVFGRSRDGVTSASTSGCVWTWNTSAGAA